MWKIDPLGECYLIGLYRLRPAITLFWLDVYIIQYELYDHYNLHIMDYNLEIILASNPAKKFGYPKAHDSVYSA